MSDYRLDIHSHSWLVIKDRCEKSLEASRNALETRGMPQEQTEFIRGRVSLAREILALGTPPQESGD